MSMLATNTTRVLASLERLEMVVLVAAGSLCVGQAGRPVHTVTLVLSVEFVSVACSVLCVDIQ